MRETTVPVNLPPRDLKLKPQNLPLDSGGMQDLDWDDIDTTPTAKIQEPQQQDVAEADAHAQAYLNRLNTYSHSKISHRVFSVADFDLNCASFAPQMLEILQKHPEERGAKEGAFMLQFARRCPLFQHHDIEDALLLSLLLEHACEQTFTHSLRLYSCAEENCGYYFIILSGVVSILASTASTSDSCSQAIAEYLELVVNYPSISSQYTKGDEYVVGSLGPSGHCGDCGEHHQLAAIVSSPICHVMAVPIEPLLCARETSRKRKMQRVVEILNVVACTQSLSASSKTQIAFNSKILTYNNSSKIVLKQGAPATYIAIVCSGMFRVVRRVGQTEVNSPSEPNLLVDIGHLGEGEMFVGGVDVLLNHQQQPRRHHGSHPSTAAGSSESAASASRGCYESSLVSLGEEYMTSEIILIEIHEFLSKVQEFETCHRLFLNFLQSGMKSTLLKSGIESAIRARKKKDEVVAESEKYASRKSPDRYSIHK